MIFAADLISPLGIHPAILAQWEAHDRLGDVYRTRQEPGYGRGDVR